MRLELIFGWKAELRMPRRNAKILPRRVAVQGWT